MGTTALMTVEDFVRMQTAETEDYELVEGELIPLSSPTPKHCIVRDFIACIVWNYFRRNPVGRVIAEVDCRIANDTVRRPDVSIFLGERAQQIDMNRIPVPFAPDIAVEVLSASESAIDVNRRIRDYLAGGSKEVWVLDHINSELFVYSNGGIRLLLSADTLDSPMLPDFAVPVADVFAAL